MRKLVSSLVLLFVLIFSVSTLSAQESEEYYSVLLKNNKQVEKFKQELADTGAEVVYEVPELGYYQVKGTPSEVSNVSKLKSVSVASPSIQWDLEKTKKIKMSEEEIDAQLEAADPGQAAFWPLQWDVQRITENGKSYDVHTGSHDTVVAVLDTGINLNHPDLAPNIVDGSKNFVPAGGFRGTEPWETGDVNQVQDLHGHGSHVSGHIAGNGGMLGVAPDLGLRAYRVFGLGSAETAWILDAMVTAADDGSDVLSMSLGGFDILGQVFEKNPETGKWENTGNGNADMIAYKRAIDYVESKGAVVVTSAGNDGLDARNNKQVVEFLNEQLGEDVELRGTAKISPADHPGVINVSATGPNDLYAVYTNYGNGFVDLATAGGDTRLYDQYEAEGRLDEYLDNLMHYDEFTLSADSVGAGYYFSVGTSMATPKVSAVVGLIIDQHDGELNPNQVKSILLKKGVEKVTGQEKQYYGNGHLNALDAVK